MYLTFSNLNSIHWIIKKRYRPLCTFQDIFKTFQVNFQDISVTHNKSGIYFTGVPNLYGHLL